MNVLGIDPGLTGGLAIVNCGGDRPRLVAAVHIPTEGEGPQREVSPLVIDFIREHAPTYAFIERAQAMPDQGSSSGFNYGKAYGALRMAVRGCLVPLKRVEPAQWKRALNLRGQPKESSRLLALTIFPEGAAMLARHMDHGPAEAALIAMYGYDTGLTRSVPIAPRDAAILGLRG